MKKSILYLAIGLTITLNLCNLCYAQYTKLFDFTNASVSGSNPKGSLFSDGTFLYGMTFQGGTSGACNNGNGCGTIFKIKPDGTGYSILLDFASTANGSNPQGSLISDGTYLYGMTTVGGINSIGVVFKIKPDGTGYSKMLDFGSSNFGSEPSGSLISVGTFLYGLSSNSDIIFKIKPDGTGYAEFYTFTGANSYYPSGTLISDGTFLYGMTSQGGTGTCSSGCGVIFKIKPDGTGYVELLNFAGTANGNYPGGSLISDGTFLYGMTSAGGANNKGTIFKIKLNGTGYAKLLDFAGTLNGSTPRGDLISVGTYLYGMTDQGGTNDIGVIFKIKSDGTGYTKLLDFAGGSNGSNPSRSLISDGTFLYGMTSTGGINGGKGTIFKYCITPLTFTQSPTICGGHSLTVGTHTYITGGTYTDVLHSYQGCDSIVTTHLTINTVDTSVAISTIAIAALAVPATYQWINCTGNTLIVGQTNQSYTATASGSYAVIVTQNGCTDTSSCYHLTTTGIIENSIADAISIYPNPSNGRFTIELGEMLKQVQHDGFIKITDELGKEVKTINLTGKQLIIEKGEMKAGVYFINIKTKQGIVSKKLIINQ